MKSNCRPEDSRADASGLVRRVTVREHPALGRTAARRQVQELFDRSRFGTKIDVPQDQPVYASLLFRSFQDLEFVWASHSPARAARSNGPSGTDSDRVVFGVASAARVSVQTGKSFFLGPGDGILASTSDPGSAIYPSASRHVSVLLPRARIQPLLTKRDCDLLRVVPHGTPGLRLLVRYLNLMRDEAGFPTPELQQSAVSHVCDLLAITLGATPDAAEMAKHRGVRAARGYAIRKDVIHDLSGKVSLEAVAARHRLTPRYVQMLFEDEGTSFTAFVREQRLLSAQRMLANPGFDHKRIGEIAYEVGFNDLSHFVRAFNKRFGMTPGEARKGGGFLHNCGT